MGVHAASYMSLQLLLTIQVVRLHGSTQHPSAYCWDDGVYKDHQYRLTRGMCLRSMKNLGSPRDFQRISEKSKNGYCLTVAILGGSITLGGPMTKLINGSHPYPAWFKRKLGASLPCQSGLGHRVLNMALSGKPSSHWVHVLQDPKFQSRIAEADIIVVEAAVNDFFQGHSGAPQWETHRSLLHGTNVHKYTEILVRRLRTLFPTSALVWLEGGWTGFKPNKPTFRRPYQWNAEDTHYDVLKHYTIAQVSLKHALQPLHSEHMRKWMEETLFLDDRHPRELGHQMLAQMLYHCITFMTHLYRASSAKDNIHTHETVVGLAESGLPQPLPTPLYVTLADARSLVIIYSIDFEMTPIEAAMLTQVAQWPHWNISREHGNQGLVSICNSCAAQQKVDQQALPMAARAAARSLLTLDFASSASELHIDIHTFNSYTDMGIFRVVLRGGKKAASPPPVLWETTIDCLWTALLSTEDVTHHTISAPHGRRAQMDEKEPLSVLHYTLELSRQPSARDNAQKLKLLRVAVGTP
eukprot:m.1168774 g.1168774  ORF g.1168774 m.1168774 type:complete len:525 (-) comp24508_c0_seq75:4900-6474(-)